MEIKIENLTKAYGDFKAVDNMNLNIADGELVGLLGPSGCGKSTTLFMLAVVKIKLPPVFATSAISWVSMAIKL